MSTRYMTGDPVRFVVDTLDAPPRGRIRDDHPAWRTGTYAGAIADLRGWHRVRDDRGVLHIVPCRRLAVSPPARAASSPPWTTTPTSTSAEPTSSSESDETHRPTRGRSGTGEEDACE